ncbi:MAG: hypothetical protein ACO3YA_04480 [Candidatus Nanopelagicaceae bacterium]
MKKSLRSTFLFLTIAPLSLSLVTGCAAGPNAATRTITQVTDGVEGEAGAVKMRNFKLVLQPDSSVVLVGTVVNQDAMEDAILAIGINGERAKLWADGGEVERLPLTLNKPQTFAGPSATAYAYLESFDVKAGYRVPVEVILQRGGIVELDAIIRERDLEFADVSLPN